VLGIAFSGVSYIIKHQYQYCTKAHLHTPNRALQDDDNNGLPPAAVRLRY